MKQQNVFSVALIIEIGGLLFGYDIAMMSGTTSILRNLFNLDGILPGFTSALDMPGTITDGNFATLNLDSQLKFI